MSPEAQEKKRKQDVSTQQREKKRKKKENKSLTDDLDSTFIEGLESNSKSCDRYHLVLEIEVVVGIHRMVAEVEAGTIFVVVVVVEIEVVVGIRRIVAEVEVRTILVVIEIVDRSEQS